MVVEPIAIHAAIAVLIVLPAAIGEYAQPNLLPALVAALNAALSVVVVVLSTTGLASALVKSNRHFLREAMARTHRERRLVAHVAMNVAVGVAAVGVAILNTRLLALLRDGEAHDAVVMLDSAYMTIAWSLPLVATTYAACWLLFSPTDPGVRHADRHGENHATLQAGSTKHDQVLTALFAAVITLILAAMFAAFPALSVGNGTPGTVGLIIVGFGLFLLRWGLPWVEAKYFRVPAWARTPGPDAIRRVAAVRTRETLLAYFRTMRNTAWGAGPAAVLLAKLLHDNHFFGGSTFDVQGIALCVAAICIVAAAASSLAPHVAWLGHLHLLVHVAYVCLISGVVHFAGGVDCPVRHLIFVHAIANVSALRGLAGAIPLVALASGTYLFAIATVPGTGGSESGHWRLVLGDAAMFAVLQASIAWYAAAIASITRGHARRILDDVGDDLRNDMRAMGTQLREALALLVGKLEARLGSGSAGELTAAVRSFCDSLAGAEDRLATWQRDRDSPHSLVAGDSNWQGVSKDLEFEEVAVRLRKLIDRMIE
jgi:hypothetical protein